MIHIIKMLYRNGGGYKISCISTHECWPTWRKSVPKCSPQKELFLGSWCVEPDYINLKPKGHPVQPELEDVFKKVDEFMAELDCTHIYLASDEARVEFEFRKKYGDKILVNKREYYDDIYYGNRLAYIGEVHFDRKDDDYFKGIEYFSSLYILSRCIGLVGGNCGGSQAAVFMNNLKYKKNVHI